MNRGGYLLSLEEREGERQRERERERERERIYLMWCITFQAAFEKF